MASKTFPPVRHEISPDLTRFSTNFFFFGYETSLTRDAPPSGYLPITRSKDAKYRIRVYYAASASLQGAVACICRYDWAEGTLEPARDPQPEH